jgi:hypothetical protein
MPLDSTGVVEAGHVAVGFFERALAKSPEHRFDSAAEMADAMRELVEALKSSGSPSECSVGRSVQVGK